MSLVDLASLEDLEKCLKNIGILLHNRYSDSVCIWYNVDVFPWTGFNIRMPGCTHVYKKFHCALYSSGFWKLG